MNVGKLVQAAEPFRRLAGHTNVSSTYRCLELTASGIRGCSSFALLEAKIAMEGLSNKPLYVDSAAFLAVVSYLNNTADIVFTPKENLLEWECNTAKGKIARGKLALVSLEGVSMPRMKLAPKGTPEFRSTKQFRDALEMGALSASTTAIAGTSMYGVVLDNRQGFAVYSSDNTTMSEAIFDSMPVPAPERMTLVPEAITLLNTVVADTGVMQFGASDVYYNSPAFTCYIKAKDPLKHDLATIMADYESMETAALLPRENINSFIKRVSALAESKRNVVVTLTANDNQLGVSFEETATSSEESYLIDDMAIDGELSVALDGTKLARALGYVDHVVLDFVNRGVVMFVGTTTNFRYLVSSRG